MALPFAMLAGALGQALLHVATKPWPWVGATLLFAVAKFDFGIFAEEVRNTLWGLWPFILLIILAWILIAFFRIWMTESKPERRSSK